MRKKVSFMTVGNRGNKSQTSFVFRASGQNMRAAIQGFGGGSNWSSCYRSRHYSNAAFISMKVVIPWFYQTPAATLIDTDFPASYNVQVGLEYPFNNSFSGISNRTPFTFSGSNVVSYVAGVGPLGFSVSDPLSFTYTPGSVAAPNFFGLWTTVENAAGSGSAAQSLPYQANSSNNYQAGWQRYTGALTTNSSLIAAGTALTASSISTVSNDQTGINANVFTPCLLLIQTNKNMPCIFGVGDSLGYGVNEGQAGSNTYGDSLGSALGNAGFLARWVYETLGYNFVNFTHGSDAFFKYSAANWKYRLPLMTLANPTAILSQSGHNDISAGKTTAVTTANANIFYTDVRAACSNVPIIQTCCSPDSSSTDAYVTTANQTPRSGFGDATSLRGQFNALVKNKGLGNNGFIDPNPIIEFGTDTSKWNVTGVANGYTSDGTHPNSFGYSQISANMIVNPFV